MSHTYLSWRSVFSGLKSCGIAIFLLHAAMAQMPSVMSVEVAPAEQREVARSLEFTGSIEPWRVIELSSQVEGMVEAVPVEEGQRIAAGDMVTELDEAAVKIEIERLKANMAAAASELDKFEAGNRKEDIEVARRRVEEAEARLKAAQDDWERQRQLAEEGVISQNEAAQLRSTFEQAEAALAQARASQRLAEAGFRSEEIATQSSMVAVRQAELHDAERRLRLHEIKAPVDAVVTQRLKEPGEWVQVGDPVARLVVLDPLKVRIEVPQIYYPKISMGQQATLTVDGLPNEKFKAEVTQVIPSATAETRNFPVLLRLPNEERKLSSGLFSRVKLNVGEPQPSILVPNSAVQVRGESQVVLKAERIPPPPEGAQPAPAPEGVPGGAAGMPPAPQPDAVIREVTVRTGTEIGNLVAIEPVGGELIAPGDLVVTQGGTRLSSGIPVRILPGGAMGAPGAGAAGGAPGAEPAPAVSSEATSTAASTVASRASGNTAAAASPAPVKGSVAQ